MSDQIKVTVLRGVAGYVLAVNDRRVTGPRSGPYSTVAEWKVYRDDLLPPSAPSPDADPKSGCGCLESYPQLIPGSVSHGPGCAQEACPACDDPKDHEATRCPECGVWWCDACTERAARKENGHG